MKYLKLYAIILAIISPVAVLFIFDLRYNNFHDSMCTELARPDYYACDYPERYERERLVTTAFYRHLGSIFGRSEGTSLALITSIRYDPPSTNTSNTNMLLYEFHERFGRFNMQFFSAIVVSMVLSTAASTITISRIYSGTKHRRKIIDKHKIEQKL